MARTSQNVELTVGDQPHTPSPWPLAAVGAVGALGGVVAILLLGGLRSPSSSPHGEATRAVTPPPAATARVEAAPAPTWVGRRQAVWSGDGSKTIEFELQALSDVPVWMARVRPLLVARCLSRTTEVFVAIRSSASVESQTGSHTVRLRIDDDQEVVQKWSDSVSSQELFAPNARELVGRLARAERMRFGFTPYNAEPVVAEFRVAGFDQLARLVAGTCGWRLDESGAASTKSARLN